MQFYGTLGPACNTPQAIKTLFAVGMTGMRINMSHQSLHDCRKSLAEFREVAPINAQLLIDLQGPELRMQNTTPISLSTNEIITLGDKIPVPQALIAALMKKMTILLDDGAIELSVVETAIDRASCRVIRGGILAPRKSIDIADLALHMPTLTESDLKNLAQVNEYGVTGVMLPFVREAADLIALRSALVEANAAHVRVFAKIENMSGVEMLPTFLDYADEIVIARGDLGNHMPIWELPRVQKEIAAKCRAAKIPFMIVTQLLNSMIVQAFPTRAEVCDIFNAVLDGASSLMLTGETAMGAYPIEAMEMLHKTACEAENWQ